MLDELAKTQKLREQEGKASAQFEARFDEILDALRRMEKRLHSTSRNQTERILNSIQDLDKLLNSCQIPDQFQALRKQLQKLRKHFEELEATRRPSDDEFYFVPAGSHHNADGNNPTAAVGQHSTKGDTKSHKKKLAGYVPVYGNGIEVPQVKIKTKIRPRSRSKYDLTVTSKPEALAIRHSQSVLKTLKILY